MIWGSVLKSRSPAWSHWVCPDGTNLISPPWKRKGGEAERKTEKVVGVFIFHTAFAQLHTFSIFIPFNTLQYWLRSYFLLLTSWAANGFVFQHRVRIFFSNTNKKKKKPQTRMIDYKITLSCKCDKINRKLTDCKNKAQITFCTQTVWRLFNKTWSNMTQKIH